MSLNVRRGALQTTRRPTGMYRRQRRKIGTCQQHNLVSLAKKGLT